MPRSAIYCKLNPHPSANTMLQHFREFIITNSVQIDGEWLTAYPVDQTLVPQSSSWHTYGRTEQVASPLGGEFWGETRSMGDSKAPLISATSCQSCKLKKVISCPCRTAISSHRTAISTTAALRLLAHRNPGHCGATAALPFLHCTPIRYA